MDTLPKTAKPRCYNCGSVVPPGDQFCSAPCYHQYQARMTAARAREKYSSVDPPIRIDVI